MSIDRLIVQATAPEGISVSPIYKGTLSVMPSSCIVVASLLISIHAFTFVYLLYEKLFAMARKSMIKP